MKNRKRSRKFNTKKLLQKYLLVMFSLALVFSPFSSLGQLAYAEGDGSKVNNTVEIQNVEINNNENKESNNTNDDDADKTETDDSEDLGTSENPDNDGNEAGDDSEDVTGDSNKETGNPVNGSDRTQTGSSDTDDETIVEEDINPIKMFAVTQANNPTSDGFEWSENQDGTVTITGYEGNEENLSIPNEIDGKSVTHITGSYSISNGVFAEKKLKSVTLPDTLKSIGLGAFYNNQIEKIDIPDSVESIGQSAFRDNKITKATLPNTLTRLSSYVFRDNQIQSIDLPNSLTYISNSAFENNQLTKIVIPNHVKAIEESAFRGNELTVVTFPNSLEKIGNLAFSRNQLEAVHIPASVNELGTHLFTANPLETITVDSQNTHFKDINKKGLYTIDGKKIIQGTTSGEIDENTETIGASAFSSLNVNAITIPSKVKTIESSAFGSNNLTGSLTIPHNVMSISDFAFSQNNLTEINILNYNIELNGGRIFEPVSQNSQDVTIYGYENSTAHDYATEYNHKFETLILAKNITEIEEINPIEIPFGEKLESIHFPDELRVTIEESGQNSTMNIGVIWDLNSYNRFKSGEQTIQGTLVLPNDIGNPGNFIAKKTLVMDDSDYMVGETEDGLMIIDYTGADTDIKIPKQFGGESVTIIGGGAFWDKSLTSVEVPSTVEYIGPGAFYENNLETVVLHEGIKVIYEWAFAGNSLTSVEIPSTVELIEEEAFADNEIDEATLWTEDVDIHDDSFTGNQTNPADLTIYGYKNSDVETFAKRNEYTFVPFPHQLRLDSNDPYDFASRQLIEIVNDVGEIVGTIQMPKFGETNLLASTRLLIRDITEKDVTATGLEIAGQIVDILFVSWEYDADPNNPNEDEILNEEINDLNEEFILSLSINDDATGDIAMYHETGHDNWDYIGGEISNGFVTASVTDFSKYGVFAEVVEEPSYINISVEKVWEGQPQDSVTVHLLANDNTFSSIELSDSNIWQHTFLELPLVDGDGNIVEYTVEEEPLEGYETSISGSVEDGFTITNKEIVEEEDPVDPDEPTDPEEPTEPVDPEEPEDPDKPTDPEEPTEPVDPEKPTDPEEPTEPVDPENPEDPKFDPCDSQDPIATGCPDDKIKDDDKDQTTVTVEEDDKTTPKKDALPKTATNSYNILLASIILLIIGISIQIFVYRKNRTTQ